MSPSTNETPIPLWLDCDPGHDDAFAILLAVHHPSLRLLGISTIHGNASLQNTTANAGSLLEAIGRPDIPIYPGSKKPFCRPAVYAPDIHGKSGLDGTDLLPKASRPPVTDKNAILAIRDAILDEPKGTAWVVATGALTNVALLFATFPEVAEHIQGLSIMGGAIGNGFTDAPMSRLPEYINQGLYTQDTMSSLLTCKKQCDPESAQSILSNPILAPKTTLIALDLTHQVLASKDVQSRILTRTTDLSSEPTVLRRILYALLTFFAKTYKDVFGLNRGPPLHDPLAVAVVLSNLNPSFTKSHPDKALKFNDHDGERFVVNVVTDGKHGKDVSETGQLGRTIVQPAAGGGVAIPRGVDLDAFWDLIVDCIQRADNWNAAHGRK